jgi:hypothetical protein
MTFPENKMTIIENNNIIPITHAILVIYFNDIKGLDKIV